MVPHTSPPGFDLSPHENHACKLKKALYGLKQAPRAWYNRFDTFLLSQGLHKSSADQNLYSHIANDKVTLLLLYVDDVYITGNNPGHITLLHTAVTREFDISDLGQLSFSLRIEFLFQPSGILFTQRQYIQDMLLEFGLAECRRVATPMLDKHKLEPEMDSPPSDPVLYQRMVGKLIFLTHTRPDISFAIGILSRFMTKPLKIHAQAVKHLYWYLRGTTNLTP